MVGDGFRSAAGRTPIFNVPISGIVYDFEVGDTQRGQQHLTCTRFVGQLPRRQGVMCYDATAAMETVRCCVSFSVSSPHHDQASSFSYFSLSHTLASLHPVPSPTHRHPTVLSFTTRTAQIGRENTASLRFKSVSFVDHLDVLSLFLRDQSWVSVQLASGFYAGQILRHRLDKEAWPWLYRATSNDNG